MKNRLSRLIALLLVIASLVSAFAVFAYAETGDGETDDKEDSGLTTLYVNRDFDEGWDVSNGIGAAKKSNIIEISSEKRTDLTTNYFVRFEAVNSNDPYVQFTPTDKPTTGNMVFECSLRLEDYNNCGRIAYISSASGKTVYDLFTIKNNALTIFDTQAYTFLSDEWVNIAIVFRFETGIYDFYVNDMENPAGSFSTGSVSEANNGLRYIRMGFGSGNTKIGMSYCMDNFKVYSGDNTLGITDLGVLGYGTMVDSTAPIVIPIASADGGLTTDEALTAGLLMKLNVNYALVKNVRTPIYTDSTTGEVYGAPRKIEDTVYIPLNKLMDVTGYTGYFRPDGLSYDINTDAGAIFISVGRNTATACGKRVDLSGVPIAMKEDGHEYMMIALDDVEKLFDGWYVYEDSMGLITVTQYENVFNHDTDIDKMCKYMKKFIFDYATGDQVVEMEKEYTNNFTHPYLVTNQKRFDELNDVYLHPEKDPTLAKWMNSILVTATNYWNTWISTDSSGKYTGLKQTPTLPYADTNGYDPAGGRLNESANYNRALLYWAYAYQITRDTKYISPSYDFAIAMGKWTHWGPAHFLNCADATAPFSIAYDWMYNAYVDTGKDVSALEDIIYSKGVLQGWNSTHGILLFPRLNGADASQWTEGTNNWNAVCSSGMMLGCLAIAGSESGNINQSYVKELMQTILYNLPNYGLGEYAPDGSYVESCEYWDYGTNTFILMVECLESATGYDFGLMNCWGMDKTVYFVLQCESSEYLKWQYHDAAGVKGGVDTTQIAFFGQFYGDAGILALRYQQIAGGKAASIYDTLFYHPEDMGIEVELPLSYYMEGIDGFVTRESWDRGAMYAGIMGGDNACSHGDIDAGSFIYYNKGITWIQDMGRENYNVYQYFNASRYRYYRKNAEGSNSICITTLQEDLAPYGQVEEAVADITETYADEYGSYTKIDMTDPLGGDTIVSFARRGMLYTNDRKTLVIQDEISFITAQTMYWFAHTLQSLSVSSDGKTATFTTTNDGITYRLRATLVSPTTTLKFSITDAENYVLKTTFDYKDSTALGGVAQLDRSKYKKLTIEAVGTLSFSAAVVIELIDSDEEQPVGYEWTPMAQWKTYESMDNTGKGEQAKRPDAANIANLKPTVIKINAIVANSTYLGTSFDNFYQYLTDIYYIFKTIEPAQVAGFEEKYGEAYEKYQGYLEDYNSYKAEIEKMVENVNKVSASLCGVGKRK